MIFYKVKIKVNTSKRLNLYIYIEKQLREENDEEAFARTDTDMQNLRYK